MIFSRLMFHELFCNKYLMKCHPAFEMALLTSEPTVFNVILPLPKLLTAWYSSAKRDPFSEKTRKIIKKHL